MVAADIYCIFWNVNISGFHGDICTKFGAQLRRHQVNFRRGNAYYIN